MGEVAPNEGAIAGGIVMEIERAIARRSRRATLAGAAARLRRKRPELVMERATAIHRGDTAAEMRAKLELKDWDRDARILNGQIARFNETIRELYQGLVRGGAESVESVIVRSLTSLPSDHTESWSGAETQWKDASFRGVSTVFPVEVRVGFLEPSCPTAPEVESAAEMMPK